MELYKNKKSLIPNHIFTQYMQNAPKLVYLGEVIKDNKKYFCYLSLDTINTYPESVSLKDIFISELADKGKHKNSLKIITAPLRNLMYDVGVLNKEVLKADYSHP